MKTSKVKLEVCVADAEGVLTAARAGVERIELCSALELGGLTPSKGMTLYALCERGPAVNVLIRPRPGNFAYTPKEIAVMVHDIDLAGELGADGVVIGALTADGDINMPDCREMIRIAWPMEVTFNRAFDRCRRPMEALEQIIDLGCRRVLTSGQKATAIEGLPTLTALCKQAGDRIIVMPGAGVNADNAVEIIRRSGCAEIHASCKEACSARNADEVAMGSADVMTWQTSAQKINALINAINNA